MPELDHDSASLRASWSQCVELFEHYKPHFSSASCVLQILEILEGSLQTEDSVPAYTNEDIPTDGPRVLGSTVSLSSLEELGFDSNWAMLDDLLQGDWDGNGVSGDLWAGETAFDTGWES